MQEWAYYLPDRTEDQASMEDMITTLNLPLIGVLEHIQGTLGHSAVALVSSTVLGLMEKYVPGMLPGRPHI
jgi:hypothetical protein